MEQTNPLKIPAVYKTDNPNEHLLLVEVLTNDGKYHDHLMPRAWMSDPRKIVAELYSIDAALPADEKAARDLVKAILATEGNAKRKRLTDKTGWADAENYVRPEMTYGPAAQKIRHRQNILNSRKKPGPKRREILRKQRAEQLESWKNGISPLCEASSYATFAIGLALSGPILSFFSPPTGLVFNTSGPSGSGKSSILTVAQSVVCSPNKLGGLDVTQTRLEELAAEANDSFLALDDMGTAELSTAGIRLLIKALSYSVRDGKGRQRSKTYDAAVGHDTLNWRVSVLTNSEERLSAYDAKMRNSGELNRFVDVFVPDKGEGGVLDLLTESQESFNQDAATIISTATKAASENHSVCLERFLRALTKDSAKSKKFVLAHQARFCAKVRKNPAYDSIQDRYVQAFGKVYAALQLAVRIKAVPFDADHAKRCAMKVFEQSELVRAPGHAQHSSCGALVDKLLAHVISSELCPLVQRGETPQAANLWCFKRRKGGTVRIYVSPNGLERFFGQADAKRLEKHLVSTGVQIADTDGNDRAQVGCPWIDPPTKRPRLIELDEDLLREMISSAKP